jgi:glutamate dehydrogenase
MRATWSDIESLDAKINAGAQYEMMFETTRLLQFCTYWLIQRHSNDLDIDQRVTRLRAGLRKLDSALPRVLCGSDLAVFQSRHNYYRAAEAPDALSKRIASLAALRSGPDIVDIADQTRLSVEPVAAAYFNLGTALSLDWIREQTEELAADGPWQAVARTTLRDNVYALQRKLCLQVLAEARKQSPDQAVTAWLQRKRAAIDHIHHVLSDMRGLASMDFATLSVAVQAVRGTVES